jgi:hypothetical protein
MKSLSLSIEGRSCRFCQQCGKFHLVGLLNMAGNMYKPGNVFLPAVK